MKNKILLSLALLLLLVSASFGQTILTNTTLSAAVTSTAATAVRLTSATGVNAPSTSDNTKATYLYVDRELMFVTSVNSTVIGVVRGAEGTVSSTHANSALVFVIPAYVSIGSGGAGYGFGPGMPAGSCTRTDLVSLPRINYVTGVISDCLGGQWVNGDAAQSQRSVGPIVFPPLGNVLYTAVETNGTAAGASTEMYCEEVDLPYSKLLTGMALLNGTTATTDNHNVILYDSGGKLLANSAAAGAVASGASAWQKYNFTTPFYAVGPAQYFGCFTANGTTATVRHTITSVNDAFSAGKITGLTFGTIATSITPPSTFTTALGPYLQLY